MNLDGTTLTLHWAARHGHAQAVTALISAETEPNAQRRDGGTPMDLAAENGHAQAVTTLLDAGAEPNARDKGGRTPRGYPTTAMTSR